MVPAAELELGRVAVVRQDGHDVRIQIVGLPKVGRVERFRGFTLQPGDRPRHPQTGGNEFVDFLNDDSCFRVEGDRWENHKSTVPARLSTALA